MESKIIAILKSYAEADTNLGSSTVQQMIAKEIIDALEERKSVNTITIDAPYMAG